MTERDDGPTAGHATEALEDIPDASERTVPSRPAFAPHAAPHASDALSDGPELPGSLDLSDPPDLSDAPGVPDTLPPGAPESPDLPDVPSAPGMPSVPDAVGLGGTAAEAASSVVPGSAGRALGTIGQVASAVQTAVSVTEGVISAARAIGGLVSGTSGEAGTGLQPVRFSFEAEGVDSEWRVETLRGREGISELYEHTLELTSERDADPRELLGRSAVLVLQRPGGPPRRVPGVVLACRNGGLRRTAADDAGADRRVAHVVLVPALRLLGFRQSCRIFQDKTAVDIVGEVLGQALAPLGRSFRAELTRQHPKREYCVQYRETDLAFVRRLLEDEGIGFLFDLSGEHEEVVLFETHEALPILETLDGAAIRIAPEEADLASAESIRRFDVERSLGTTSVVLRDFDFTQPSVDLTKEARGTDDRSRDFEVYDYAAVTLHRYDDGGRRYGAEDTQVRAKLRREEHLARAVLAKGRANVTTFCAGYVFELEGHVDPAVDGKYVLTRVEHTGHAPTTDTGHESDASRPQYVCTFRCIPFDQVFRPERTHPRPLISGPQTATVVGPAGEEIHTDPHGRVRVRFHWDRETPNERSSAWLRVKQTWSGPGYGTWVLPRIGMEVVVEHLEGNLDRPIVTGCVYNGAHQVPYELPEHKTRTVVFRTQSSPGGEGFNELWLEDEAGNEQVYLHAQKDYREDVENDQSSTVKGSRSASVSGGDSTSVGGDQSLSVTGSRTHQVEASETVGVNGGRTSTIRSGDTLAVIGAHATSVTGDETHSVTGTRNDTVNGAVEELRGGDRTTKIVGMDTHSVGTLRLVNVGNGHVVTQGGNNAIRLQGGNAEIDTPGTLHLHNPAVSLKAEGGKLTVTAAEEVVFVVGGSTVKIKSSGQIELTGPVAVHLQSGGTGVKAEPAGATVSGPKVTVSGGDVSITGSAGVKINE